MTRGRWMVVSLRAPAPGEEILLVDALRRLGGSAVDRQGERFVAWFPPPDDPGAFLAQLRSVVHASTTMDDPWLTWRWAREEEWLALWNADVRERRVSERMVVVPTAPPDADSPPGAAPPPSGDAPVQQGPPRPDPTSEAVIIRLLPSSAFGTAEHPTTRSCLRLLEGLVEPGSRIADIGCGSGILSIAAVRLGAERVLAVEADPAACRATRANAAANEVAAGVEIRRMRVRARDVARLGPFTGIVANLPAPDLLPLTRELARVTAPHGWLLLSGASRGERDALVERAASGGVQPMEEVVEEGWWSGVFRAGPPA